MCESMVEQIAAIHRVDLVATGLDVIGTGTDYVSRELDHWSKEMVRVRRGPLPALDRLVATLRDEQPEP
jgi:aminoglycoside phosphotransferase (APT) family kinase protein